MFDRRARLLLRTVAPDLLDLASRVDVLALITDFAVQPAGIAQLVRQPARDLPDTRLAVHRHHLPRKFRILEREAPQIARHRTMQGAMRRDRKSTRLNSSHLGISYAVFC